MSFARGLRAGEEVVSNAMDNYERAKRARITREVQQRLAEEEEANALRQRAVRSGPLRERYVPQDPSNPQGAAPGPAEQVGLTPDNVKAWATGREAPDPTMRSRAPLPEGGVPRRAVPEPQTGLGPQGTIPERPAEVTPLTQSRRARIEAEAYREAGLLDEAREAQARADALDAEEVRNQQWAQQFERQGEQFDMTFDQSVDQFAKTHNLDRDQLMESIRNNRARNDIARQGLGIDQQRADAYTAASEANARQINAIADARELDNDQRREANELGRKYAEFVAEGGRPQDFADTEAYRQASPGARSVLVERAVGVGERLQQLGNNWIKKRFAEAGDLEGMVQFASDEDTLTPNSGFYLDTTTNAQGDEIVQIVEYVNPDPATGATQPRESVAYRGSRDGAKVFLNQYAEDPAVGAAWSMQQQAQRQEQIREAVTAAREGTLDMAKARAQIMETVSEFPEFYGLEGDPSPAVIEDMVNQIFGFPGGGGDDSGLDDL